MVKMDEQLSGSKNKKKGKRRRRVRGDNESYHKVKTIQPIPNQLARELQEHLAKEI